MNTVKTPTSIQEKRAGGPQPVAAFPLTPMQHWFFGQELNDAHHWNQAFLFNVSERLFPDALRQALTAVVDHHAALRLRFTRRGQVWEQCFHPAHEDDILTIHDLSGHADARLKREIERACKVTQARLNFEFGPVIRATYLDCGDDRPGRLMVAVHHLCVDSASWSVFLEDLESAYRQEVAHRPVILPRAPVNYTDYALATCAWPQSASAEAELPVWQEIQQQAAATPEAGPEGQEHGANSEGNAFTVTHALSVAETALLEQSAAAVWHADAGALLVAALAAVLTARSRQPVCSFTMNGSGRRLGLEGQDFSRSVGWFSCLYPVVVAVPVEADAAALIKAAQEALARTPGDGSGFGALCCSDKGLALSNTEPGILFHYAGGDAAITGETTLFSIAPENTGASRGAAADRKYAMEFTAMVKSGAMEIAITGGGYLHEPEELQALADEFCSVLRQLMVR